MVHSQVLGSSWTPWQQTKINSPSFHVLRLTDYHRDEKKKDDEEVGMKEEKAKPNFLLCHDCSAEDTTWALLVSVSYYLSSALCHVAPKSLAPLHFADFAHNKKSPPLFLSSHLPFPTFPPSLAANLP
jgi:hypothetical protein